MTSPHSKLLGFVLVCILYLESSFAAAAKVTVELGNAQGVTMVGAIHRWDQDGNHCRLPDQAAKIETPYVDARAVDDGKGRWVFKNLPKGKYDLVIMAEGRRRIEGFQFINIKEFDPIMSPKDTPEEEAGEFVLDDIKKSPHYENKVVPLYMAGNEKTIRVLMMLLRDKPTTYEEIKNAATFRHEIWQYTWNYGGWEKEKRTKVMDRVIMNGDELRKWTWLWDSKLGGIKVGGSAITIQYDLPKPSDKTLKGLYPY